jgi:hypothetical protein
VLQAHKQAFLLHLSGSQLVQGTPLQISKLHQRGRHKRPRPQWGYNQASKQHSDISKNPRIQSVKMAMPERKRKQKETCPQTNKQTNNSIVESNCNCRKKKEVDIKMPTKPIIAFDELMNNVRRRKEAEKRCS